MKERPLLSPASEARLRRQTRWLPALLLALLCAGCPEPGDLENANSYCKPGQSMVGANGQVTCSDSASQSCDAPCMTNLLTGCKGCHTKTVMQAQLDFESPGLSARLKNKPATHSQVDNPQSCPTGDKLIDSATPSASWLLKKVSGQQGGCGMPMPPEGASTDEIACMTTYVSCVGAAP